MSEYNTPTLRDLHALLKRAEAASRVERERQGGAALAEAFDQEREKQRAMMRTNLDGQRDRLRSEAEAMELQDLEARRLFDGDLSDEEEARRRDLNARRMDSGYIRAEAPAADDESTGQ